MVPSVSGHEPSARTAALEALRHMDRAAGFLRDDLHAIFVRLNLPARDRALAMQLAAGVVRHRRTLRLVLGHLRGEAGRVGAIQPPLRAILELGAFQLLFLDRVPAYAAVNEAVAAARDTARGPRGKKVAGFVNGMLRGLARLVVGHDPNGQPARDALPHPDGGVMRLKEAVLPDPQADRAAFLGAAYSFPDWLTARWLESYAGRAEEICRWNNRRPRTFARLNPMRTSDVARPACPAVDISPLIPPRPDKPAVPQGSWNWEQEGVTPGPRSGCVDVSVLPLERLETLLIEGVFTVQDPSSMAAVEALAPAAGESVLDLCASPGTKTTQIVEAMGDRGRVVAADRSEDKLEPVRATASVRHMASVTVCLAANVGAAAPAAGFDAALVDAPCSNTGVLARRAEARWRLRPEDLEELPRVQGQLLRQAAALVRPGGRLVYSTCSLEHEENEGVVGAFLRENAAWRLDRQELLLPGPDHDGAFWALLRQG